MVIEEWKKCTIASKFPTYRNSKIVTTKSWLDGKQMDDEAEGLWRIYDSLYDFTEFIDKHPGGPFWIRETKGLDITEAFEAHHLTSTPSKMIEKYKVRDASKPRTYTLTLYENGFYKTLKKRIAEKMKTIDNKPKKTTDAIHIGLILSTFIFSMASAKFDCLACLALAGASLVWTVVSSHNYFHRRDNWHMYAFNLGMLNFASWRVSHSLSHHIYPNSYLDMELSMFEPLLCWIPNPFIKSKMMRYVSWITEPISYVLIFFLETIKRIVYSLCKSNIMYWHDIICLSLPLSMYLCSDQTLLWCLRQWLYITAITSFSFCFIGLNAAHHDPKIYHEGDTCRDDRDWGLYQVDTIIDRADLKGSQFLVLTHFGDHALHHLFPTLDHGILPQLYPILYETLDEFKCELRECSGLHHLIGQHKQLLRTQANPKPPCCK
ncbi:cytochrome b5-related protein-like [Cochliomyia hominivorax]